MGEKPGTHKTSAEYAAEKTVISEDKPSKLQAFLNLLRALGLEGELTYRKVKPPLLTPVTIPKRPWPWKKLP